MQYKCEDNRGLACQCLSHIFHPLCEHPRRTNHDSRVCAIYTLISARKAGQTSGRELGFGSSLLGNAKQEEREYDEVILSCRLAGGLSASERAGVPRLRAVCARFADDLGRGAAGRACDDHFG